MFFRLLVSCMALISLDCAIRAETPNRAATAEASRRSYNLPSGDAATTLKQFAARSGEQIVYLLDNVRGEKTNPVIGEFAAREALDRMLAGTELFASRDEATGALVVGRVRSSESKRSREK